jgi:uncharacterized protein (TIGR02145 family)
MKTKSILTTLIAIVAVITLVSLSCQKDEENNQPLKANFSANITAGAVSLSVNFSDQSINNPTSWQWDFGDGGKSTQQNPIHIYNNEGNYTVQLIASNDLGSDTEIKNNYITVTGEIITGKFNDPRDGQIYNTVEINNQTWFSENLNFETANSWWYDNDPANGDIYGRLYTWDAAMSACPTGWHLPSDDEWKELEIYLGMSQTEADATEWRGTNQGKQMKSTSGWYANGNGINSSGFTALPGGFRFNDGSFQRLGERGTFWSSSEGSGTTAWYRNPSYNFDQVYRNNFNKANSYSCRCLKD